jgi:hypothetical protein
MNKRALPGFRGSSEEGGYQGAKLPKRSLRSVSAFGVCSTISRRSAFHLVRAIPGPDRVQWMLATQLLSFRRGVNRPVS